MTSPPDPIRCLCWRSRHPNFNTARDGTSTKFIEECFGVEPTVVRLQAFRESEQRQLFEHWFPEENFEKFSNEVERFELKPLLGNPQFLQLLGEAYIEGGRHFTSKAQIFSDAVKRLAHESNQNLGRQNRPPIDALISHAGEIFAKLMLSGATGVSSIQKLSDLDFPYVRSLSNGDAELLKRMLDSRLFKPSVDADHNEPVHRIVAEYCAARYLVQRIDDSGDLLSLSRILSIIAPNGVVRDELRGMIGWMAALGGPAIQKAAIEIDPYAVLANGDPSQLSASSKRFLLDRLQALAKQDTYFRRSDVWRTFNVGKFFSIDIVENLRPLLAASSQERTLRDLVLELLPGTEAAGALVSELQAVTLNSTAGEHARLLALRVLLPIPSYEGASNLATLIAEGTGPVP